jgi:hypothetical protein
MYLDGTGIAYGQHAWSSTTTTGWYRLWFGFGCRFWRRCRYMEPLRCRYTYAVAGDVDIWMQPGTIAAVLDELAIYVGWD